MSTLRRTLGPAILAFVIAAAIAAIALLATGHSPLTAYQAMWGNIDGSVGLGNIFNETGQIYVAALAVAIGFKMNLFNIGTNGQLSIAALFAGAVGGAVHLTPWLHVGIIVTTAVVAGAAYAGIAGVLKITRNVNEVVATIMLNGVAVGIIGYLLKKYFRDKSEQQVTHTVTIAISGRIPPLDRFLRALHIPLADGAHFNGYLVVAILAGAAFYVLIYRSRFGFDLRASGTNAAAARTSGVNPKRMIVITMLLSGALAGLAAISPLLSSQYEYGDRFPVQLGFTGIAIALLGRNHPAGIAFAAFVWSAIEQGARALAGVGVPSEIGQLLQGTLLFVAMVVYQVTTRRSQARSISDAAQRTTSTPPPVLT